MIICGYILLYDWYIISRQTQLSRILVAEITLFGVGEIVYIVLPGYCPIRFDWSFHSLLISSVQFRTNPQIFRTHKQYPFIYPSATYRRYGNPTMCVSFPCRNHRFSGTEVPQRTVSTWFRWTGTRGSRNIRFLHVLDVLGMKALWRLWIIPLSCTIPGPRPHFRTLILRVWNVAGEWLDG